MKNKNLWIRFMGAILLFGGLYSCKEKKQTEQNEQIVKFEEKRKIKAEQKLKQLIQEFNVQGEFREISLKLFKDFDSFKGKNYLVEAESIDFSFPNMDLEFSPIIKDGKYLAMMEGKPITVFELTIPEQLKLTSNEQLNNRQNLIFQLESMDFFIDYYEEMIVCLDNKDMDYDCLYDSENMIYRRIKGELLEVF